MDNDPDPDPDTVHVQLLVEDTSFLNNNASMAEILSHQGQWPWKKILYIGLITLCAIGLLLATLYFVLGRKIRRKTSSQDKKDSEKLVTPETKSEPVADA